MKIILTALLLLFPGLVFGTVTVTASLEPSNPTLEDEVVLTVIVHGSQKTTEPVLPSLGPFKIISTGSATSIQILYGQTDFRREFTYVMVPVQEGNFTIAPITVSAEGVEYKTDPIHVTVGRGGASPRGPRGIPTNPSDPQPPSTAEEPAAGEEGKPYWITASVSKSDPYMNEGILYTFRFFTSVNVGDANLTLPDFKDFLAEEVIPEKKYYRDIGVQRYVVSEKVIALYPLQTGDVSIGNTLLEVAVPEIQDNFFDPFGLTRRNMRVKRLSAPAMSIKVKPLPPAPDDFSNLVGEFTMTSRLTETEIKAGDSVTLEIEISGRGNIKDAILPKTNDIPGFKIYDDKPAVEVTRKDDGIWGKKIFKRALVPTRAMEITLAAPSLSYFDPKEGIYKKMEGTSAVLKVLPSANAEPEPQTGSAPMSPALGNGDLAPPHLAPPYREKSGGAFLWWLIGLLPPLIFFSFLLARLSQRRAAAHRGANKSKRALKLFRAQLRQIAKMNPDKGHPTLLAAVKTYVGDRLGTYGQALTVSDLCLKMQQAGINNQQTLELQKALEGLEEACYGLKNSKPLSEWISELALLVSKLDNQIKAAPIKK